MKKRFFSILSLLLIISLMGQGCRGLSSEEQAAIRPITLNYWTVFDDVDQLRQLAAQYTAIRPYVTMNIRQVRVEEFEDLFVNALAEDVGPDIVSLHVRWLRKHQNKLSAMPASVQVANVTTRGTIQTETVVTPQRIAMPTPAAVRSNFVQTVANDVIIGGQIYGLPLAMDTLALYYNQDLLDKAGIPEAPSTWEQFLDAVRAATTFDAGGDIIQSGVALGGAENIQNAPDILAMLMMQNGIDMQLGSNVAFAQGLERPAVNHPALEALRFYTDFAQPTKEAYSWNEGLDNALDAFVRGNTVFYFGFAFDYPRITARAPQMNLSVIPVPQLDAVAPANVANYWVESVTKKSPNQDEAWDFVRFITSEQNIKSYTDTTQHPSPLRAHISAQAEDVILAPFVSQLLVAENWYRGRDTDAADRALRNLITGYLEPYGERENPLARDAELIRNAARVIQQTL